MQIVSKPKAAQWPQTVKGLHVPSPSMGFADVWMWHAERFNSLTFPWVVALLGLSVSCGPSLQGSPDWLGSDESPLEGFTWRGGSERDTTGILLWSEPFFCRMRTGEEVGYLFCYWFVNLVTKMYHLWHCSQTRSRFTCAVSAFICICHRKLCYLSLSMNCVTIPWQPNACSVGRTV